MKITLDLPDALAEQLRTAAAAEGADLNNYAVTRLQESFAVESADDEEADDDLIEALREGLAQADAGQLRTLDQAEETVRARLASHAKAAA